MTQIFAKTPRIYGFDSIGPSGKTVAPYLNKYLETSKNDYANFDKYSAQLSTKTNSKFMEALKKTAVDQAVGGLLNMKRVEEKPYCYIRSPQISNVDKLKYVETLLSKGDGIKILSHIQNFIHKLKADPAGLGAAEQAALENIRHNEKIKKDLMTLLNLDGDVYIPLKTNVINALRDLGVISTEAAVQGMNRILQLDKPFTEEKQNYLCSSRLSANISVDMIPAARFRESPFVIVLTSLAPNDEKIAEQLLPNLEATQTDMFLKANSIYAFHRMQSKNPRHHLAIARVATTPNLPLYVRFAISYVLSQLKSKNPEIPGLIAKALSGEDNEAVIHQYSRALSNFN